MLLVVEDTSEFGQHVKCYKYIGGFKITGGCTHGLILLIKRLDSFPDFFNDGLDEYTT